MTAHRVDKLDRIAERIRLAHYALMVETLGDRAVSKSLLRDIKRSGFYRKPTQDILKRSFTFGKAAIADKGVLDLDARGFETWLRSQGPALDHASRLLIAHMRKSFGEYVHDLGNTMVAKVLDVIAKADEALGRSLTGRKRPEAFVDKAYRDALASAAEGLRTVSQQALANAHRLVSTETHNAYSEGRAREIIKASRDPDPLVFKRPQSGTACSDCLDYYLEADRKTPRVFRMSALIANGTNVGKSRGHRRPVIDSTHPGCCCVLEHFPDGFAFDRTGKMVYRGIKKSENVREIGPAQRDPALFFRTALVDRGKVKRVNAGKHGARKVAFGNGLHAVLKPKLFGNTKNRGIPRDTQYLREAAAYQLDRVLGFGVIPPCTMTKWKNTPASVGVWVEGHPASEIPGGRGMFNNRAKVSTFCALVDIPSLRRLVLFDLIANNADRHAKNVVFDTLGHHTWGIDNGMCFGSKLDHYKNVFHGTIFRKHLQLSPEEIEHLEKITLPVLDKALSRYLPFQEIAAIVARITWIVSKSSLAWDDLVDGKSIGERYRSDVRRERPSKVQNEIDAMGASSVVSLSA